jgi:hypothetical protein
MFGKGGILATWDEGYNGERAIPEIYRDLYNGTTIMTTPKEYRDLLRYPKQLKVSLNTIQEIKDAVRAGKTVYCGTDAYIVLDNSTPLDEHFIIKCTLNNYCIGLHGQVGTEYETKLNGSDFYTKG